jgi:hypothetical protein
VESSGAKCLAIEHASASSFCAYPMHTPWTSSALALASLSFHERKARDYLQAEENRSKSPRTSLQVQRSNCSYKGASSDQALANHGIVPGARTASFAKRPRCRDCGLSNPIANRVARSEYEARKIACQNICPLDPICRWNRRSSIVFEDWAWIFGVLNSYSFTSGASSARPVSRGRSAN